MRQPIDAAFSNLLAKSLGWRADDRRSLRCVVSAAFLLLLTIFSPTGAILTGVAHAEGGKAKASAQATGQYKLGPLDKVRLRVFEYRATRDEVYEWSALNHEFAVGPNGRIAVPLIGEVEAAGHTTASLGAAIADKLRQRLGLAVRPDATVEIVQYRPFYILGTIEKPGEYAFRPGLTVLQAVTISGGLRRAAEEPVWRTEREAISGRAEFELHAIEYLTLLARRTRLEAELHGAQPTFKAPLNPSINPVVRQIVDHEMLLFKARREAQANQLETLSQLRIYLKREAESIEAQLAKHDKQIQLLKEEQGGVLLLVKHKLVSEPRRLAIERSIAHFEGERLKLETAHVRSGQELSKTEILVVDLKTRRMTEVTAELQATQSRLEHMKLRLDTSNQLLRLGEVRARLTRAGTRADGSGPDARFRLVRTVDGRVTEMDADEATAVQPGDTVRVWFDEAAGEATMTRGILGQTALTSALDQPPQLEDQR